MTGKTAGHHPMTILCGVPRSIAVGSGRFSGSTVHKTPEDAVVLGWARELLSMPAAPAL